MQWFSFKKRFRPKKGPQRVFDISHNSSKKILHLRKEPFKLEISKKNLDFIANFSKENYKILSLFGVVFIFLISVSYFTRADSTNFYASSCLGGWRNAQNAVGSPDAKNNSDFNENNSAVLDKDTLSELYCGGFSGEIPKDSTPKKVFVDFSWGLDSGTVIAPATVTTFTADTLSSSTETIIDTKSTSTQITSSQTTFSSKNLNGQASTDPDSSSSVVQVSTSSGDITSQNTQSASTDTSSGSSTTPSSASSQSSNADSSPPVTNSSDSSSASVTPLNPQPVSTDSSSNQSPAPAVSSPTQTSAQIPTSAPAVDQTPSAPSSFLDSLATKAFAADTSSSDNSNEGYLDISYTYDGNTWYELGTIGADNLTPARLEIPEGSFTDWGDLSKIQIAVKRVSSLQDDPKI